LIGTDQTQVLTVRDRGDEPEIVGLGGAVLITRGLGLQPAPLEGLAKRGAVHEINGAIQVVGPDRATVPADDHLQTEKVVAAVEIHGAKVEDPASLQVRNVVGGGRGIPVDAGEERGRGTARAGNTGRARGTVGADGAGDALGAGGSGWTGHTEPSGAAGAGRAGRTDRTADDGDDGNRRGTQVSGLVAVVAAASAVTVVVTASAAHG